MAGPLRNGRTEGGSKSARRPLAAPQAPGAHRCAGGSNESGKCTATCSESSSRSRPSCSNKRRLRSGARSCPASAARMSPQVVRPSARRTVASASPLRPLTHATTNSLPSCEAATMVAILEVDRSSINRAIRSKSSATPAPDWQSTSWKKLAWSSAAQPSPSSRDTSRPAALSTLLATKTTARAVPVDPLRAASSAARPDHVGSSEKEARRTTSYTKITQLASCSATLNMLRKRSPPPMSHRHRETAPASSSIVFAWKARPTVDGQFGSKEPSWNLENRLLLPTACAPSMTTLCLRAATVPTRFADAIVRMEAGRMRKRGELRPELLEARRLEPKWLRT
mmetsp:Transcript_77132/g.238897  ORF Transcript_77132/g.238897 Transcript_77132/m.238897 type:complete len:339 (+) Transcript_77132:166-1182(+)